MKFSDIKECSVCGGTGEDRLNCDTCINNTMSGACKIGKTSCSGDCSHCHGTGQEPVRVGLTAPNFWKFYKIDNRQKQVIFTCDEDDFTRGSPLPYQTGEEPTLVCESCDGNGIDHADCIDYTGNCEECNGYILCRVMEKCPTCKGTPKKTIKITEVEYKLIDSEHGVNVYYEVIP